MKAHVLTFGETMGLFRAAEVGDLSDVDTARIATGGADSNVAIGLARLQVPAVWVGRVGADGLGRRVVRDLRGQGVDVHAVVDGAGPTGLMVKEKRTPHTTRVWFYRTESAGSRLRPDDIPPELVESAAHVHVTGITASISASGLETVRAVMRRARRASVPVSFDVNHRASLWRSGDPAPVYRELAAGCDIVFAGEDEASLLTGLACDRTEKLLEAIARLGPATVVLKRGSAGSLLYDGDRVLERPALSVPVVDTVGAGDAFVAGFLAGRLSGEAPSECLRLANGAGAFACMGAGDWESMARSDDLLLLNNVDPVVR
ncbi:hypothetical protein UB45_21660 [Terrabacter sp. 28]|nr:hypothetical protein UB45_21660 [Terrabacter sp. 28]